MKKRSFPCSRARGRASPLLAGLVCVAGLGACSDDDSSPDRDSAVVGSPDAGIDATVPVTTPDSSIKVDAAADANGDQPVTLRFKAVLGSQELVCGQTYNDVGSSKASVTPRDFRLFVQDVRLITASGTEVPVKLEERGKYQTKDVALLDFTTGEGECTSGDPGTNTIITGSVPAGQYTGVVFTNGVPESLNHADPTTAPAPLQAPGASWGWSLGYRFLMAEVLTVKSADACVVDAGFLADGGVIAPPTGLGFVHLGSTACSGTASAGYTCSQPNRAEARLLPSAGFNPASSVIVADLAAVFSTADLSTDVQCHGSGPKCAPMFEALGVNLDTGATLTTQRVYHVE